jgi:cytidylate kinase
MSPPAKHTDTEATELLRKWARGLRVTEGLKSGQTVEQLYDEIHPCVTITGEAGAGGSHLADRVGERLGLETVDRELIALLAERYKLPCDMLEVVDERVSNWLTEAIRMWLAHRLVSQSEYLSILGRFLLMASSSNSVVFVGRGVQFILPRQKCLAIRLVAPLPQRVEWIKQRDQLNKSEAERYVSQRDEGRRKFIRSHFRSNVEDPHWYDLVINMQHVDLENAADLIVSVWNARFGQ